MLWQSFLQFSVDWLGQEPQLNASRGLPVHRIGQARVSHLFEHATYPLPKLLSQAEVGADPCYTRIASESRGLEGVAEVDKPREASWAGYLDSVIEDLDTDVIAGHAVRTMHCGVDNSLQPRILGHEWHVFKGPSCAQGSPGRLQALDLRPRIRQLLRNRPLEPGIVDELLASTRPALLTSVAQHPDRCLGQKCLRLFGEEQATGNRQFVADSQSTRMQQPLGVVRTDGDRVVLQKVLLN